MFFHSQLLSYCCPAFGGTASPAGEPSCRCPALRLRRVNTYGKRTVLFAGNRRGYLKERGLPTFEWKKQRPSLIYFSFRCPNRSGNVSAGGSLKAPLKKRSVIQRPIVRFERVSAGPPDEPTAVASRLPGTCAARLEECGTAVEGPRRPAYRSCAHARPFSREWAVTSRERVPRRVPRRVAFASVFSWSRPSKVDRPTYPRPSFGRSPCGPAVLGAAPARPRFQPKFAPATAMCSENDTSVPFNHPAMPTTGSITARSTVNRSTPQ